MIKTIILSLIITNSTIQASWLNFRKHKAKKCCYSEKYRARITYYTVGEDKWGSQVADPKTHRAKQGITIAHHPKYKFGTEVSIPHLKGIIGDGNFKVQDRGSAITRKKASHGKTYVIDVFVKDKKTMRRLARTQPQYMEVYIIKK